MVEDPTAAVNSQQQLALRCQPGAPMMLWTRLALHPRQLQLTENYNDEFDGDPT